MYVPNVCMYVWANVPLSVRMDIRSMIDQVSGPQPTTRWLLQNIIVVTTELINEEGKSRRCISSCSCSLTAAIATTYTPA